MTKTKPRRNKSYRKRVVDSAGGLAVIGAQLLRNEDQRSIPANDQDDMQLAYRLAFNIMRTGKSSEETWCTVTVSLNVALVLSERGYGNGYESYIVKALEGAFRAQQRAQRTGLWRYDGPAINDIELVLELHDEQIKLATKAELREALLEVRRRVLDGNVFKVAA